MSLGWEKTVKPVCCPCGWLDVDGLIVACENEAQFNMERWWTLTSELLDSFVGYSIGFAFGGGISWNFQLFSIIPNRHVEYWDLDKLPCGPPQDVVKLEKVKQGETWSLN